MEALVEPLSEERRAGAGDATGALLPLTTVVRALNSHQSRAVCAHAAFAFNDYQLKNLNCINISIKLRYRITVYMDL